MIFRRLTKARAVTSLSIVAANVPRLKQILAAGNGGLSYPQIQETELTRTDNSQTPGTGGLELRLVPSGSGKVTVTVTSGGKKERRPPERRPPPDWQAMMTIGSKEDEHTSTSSLFDETDREGVMLEREFRMVVENK